jgi:hypothetical protein
MVGNFSYFSAKKMPFLENDPEKDQGCQITLGKYNPNLKKCTI